MAEKKKEEEVAAEVTPTADSPEATILYTESHPILGVTRRVFKVAEAAGDGRPGDPAGPIKE